MIGDRLVVQQVCDGLVTWVDRRDNTHVDNEVQPLRVDVVRFAVVVIVHLADEGGGVTFLNNGIVAQLDEAKV